MPRREFTEAERHKIVADSYRLTKKESARINQCSLDTVYTLCKKSTLGESLATRGRVGRPKCLTERDERHVMRIVKGDRRASYRKIGIKLGEVDVNVSEDTVRRVLHDHNMGRFVAVPKPFLDVPKKKRRLNYVKDNEDVDWNKVIYTDDVEQEACAPVRVWGDLAGCYSVRRR